MQSTSAAINTQTTLPQWLPLLLSVVAILISASTFLYNRKKDKRSRTQSIYDEFWLRKVVSPIAIEPIVKDFLKVSSNLPIAKKLDTDNAKQQWLEHANIIEELRVSIGALALLSKTLPRDAEPHLDSASDILSEFYGAYIADQDSEDINKKKEAAVTNLIAAMIGILTLVQSHQEGLGFK